MVVSGEASGLLCGGYSPSAPEQEGTPGMLHPTGMPLTSAWGLQGPRPRGYSPLNSLLLCSSPFLPISWNRAERASVSVSLAEGAERHNLVVKKCVFHV